MRNLSTVIQQMLDLIPDDQAEFITTLKRLDSAQLYVAPEDQGWNACAWVLMKFMEPLRYPMNDDGTDQWAEDWCEPVLKIWRDEK